MRITSALATAVTATVLILGYQCVVSAQQAPTSDLRTGASEASRPQELQRVDIAAWDKTTNAVRLFGDRLAKTFEDGTPIDVIRIEQRYGTVYLIREGKDRDGNCITDTIELDADEKNRTLALPLNGKGSDRCHGFFCAKCNAFDEKTGCSCEIGWFCNHEKRVANGVLDSSVLFVR